MECQYLKLRTESRVGWLEYNRPPINAFNWEMLIWLIKPAAKRLSLPKRAAIFIQSHSLLHSTEFPVTSKALLKRR